MSAGELAVLVAAVLCSLGFTALVVVLVRVLDALRALRGEVEDLRAETRPLLVELRASTDDALEAVQEARGDLERFDRVLGSAEAIGDAVEGSGRVARAAFSGPMIKAAGIATGTGRAWRRLTGSAGRAATTSGSIEAVSVERRAIDDERSLGDRSTTRGERRRRRA